MELKFHGKKVQNLNFKVIANRKRERQAQREKMVKSGNGTANGRPSKTSILDEQERKGNCFLDILLDLQEQSNFTDEDIREEVETFMFEGPIFVLFQTNLAEIFL